MADNLVRFILFPTNQIQSYRRLECRKFVKSNSWTFDCEICCWHIFYLKYSVCSFLRKIFDSIFVDFDILIYIGEVYKCAGSRSLSNINVNITILKRIEKQINDIVIVRPRVRSLRVDHHIVIQSLYFRVVAGNFTYDMVCCFL